MMNNQPEHLTENSTSLPDLPGVDVEAGLVVTQNNMNLFRKLLIKFYSKHQNFEQQFLEAMELSIDDATRVAHTLKGVAGNLGITGVQQAAMNLEIACAEKKSETIRLLLDHVVDKLKTVMTGLKVLSNEEQVTESLLSANESSSGEIDIILTKLRDQVVQSNISSGNTVRELGTLIKGTAYSRYYSQLVEAIECYDFDMALELLNAIRSEIEIIKK